MSKVKEEVEDLDSDSNEAEVPSSCNQEESFEQPHSSQDCEDLEKDSLKSYDAKASPKKVKKSLKANMEQSSTGHDVKDAKAIGNMTSESTPAESKVTSDNPKKRKTDEGVVGRNSSMNNLVPQYLKDVSETSDSEFTESKRFKRKGGRRRNHESKTLRVYAETP